MDPILFFKSLADLNRLSCLCLIQRAGEACVCEIQVALNQDQPKVSQYLAQLRKCGILASERRGKWMYYRLSSELASWALETITLAIENNAALFSEAISRFDRIQPNSACNNPSNQHDGK